MISVSYLAQKYLIFSLTKHFPVPVYPTVHNRSHIRPGVYIFTKKLVFLLQRYFKPSVSFLNFQRSSMPLGLNLEPLLLIQDVTTQIWHVILGFLQSFYLFACDYCIGFALHLREVYVIVIGTDLFSNLYILWWE